MTARDVASGLGVGGLCVKLGDVVGAGAKTDSGSKSRCVAYALRSLWRLWHGFGEAAGLVLNYCCNPCGVRDALDVLSQRFRLGSRNPGVSMLTFGPH